MSESDVYRRQIPTSQVHPRAVMVNHRPDYIRLFYFVLENWIPDLNMSQIKREINQQDF